LIKEGKLGKFGKPLPGEPKKSESPEETK